MCSKFSALILFYFLNISFVLSQNIQAKPGSYGVDHDLKMIVWHVKNLDSLNQTNITDIELNTSFKTKDIDNKWSYKRPKIVTQNKTDYNLYVTKLPLVHINIDTLRINNRKKIGGYFTFYNKTELQESAMGIRHRGNLSLSFPKKSYDIEFWNDTINKVSRDLKFKNMRSDDDWILDALYNEPLRIRSTIATKLWSEIHKPYYINEETKAESGFNTAFVEVFRNGKYYGIYGLMESVDRKQLNLKKNNNNEIFGELFKAESYEGGPAFIKAPTFNNLFPHWAGFRMEFPVIDYKSHWENIFELTNLVVNESDEAFLEKIENKIYIPNTVDYYLFVNLLRATDNLGKNYFIAKYKNDEPYFFVPWDLDGVLGIIQEGKQIPTTNDILSNGLFDRLIKLNPNSYKTKLKTRWQNLRKSAFSDDALFESLESYHNSFKNESIYQREHLVWPNNFSEANNYEYLKKWLKERLIYLDAYFEAF